jgi:hypothetical protein
MNGWYQVEFREVGTKRRRTFNLDDLVRLADAKKPAAAAPRKRKDAKKRSRLKAKVKGGSASPKTMSKIRRRRRTILPTH